MKISDALERSQARRLFLLLSVLGLSTLRLGTMGMVPVGAMIARAEHPPVALMGIDEVRAGMSGVGRTVFQGDQVEEFGVEILGVLKNSRPQGDLILFRGQGATLEHTGIIGGMSGSPVYIDGRLIGAVAFAFPQAKDPIGAITPIGEMLPLLTKPGEGSDSEDSSIQIGTRDPMSGPEGNDPTDRGSRPGGPSPTVGPNADAPLSRSEFDEKTGSTGGQAFPALWAHFLRQEPSALGTHSEIPEPRQVDSFGRLDRLVTPICLAGWEDAVSGEITTALPSLGFVATAVPGGDEPERPTHLPLEPGNAVGVQLIRGDADLVAIGTVTYVDGDRVLAFGHPMVHAGRVAFPMTGAWIHGVIPNLVVSSKIGSSTGVVGGIWDDRRTGISGTLGTSPELLPVSVSLTDEEGSSRRFHYEVVRNPILTPLFLPWTVTNSYLAAGWVFGDAAAQSEVTVHFNGGAQVTRRERFSTNTPGTALGSDIAMPAALLLINPFERVRIDSISVKLAYDRKNSQAKVLQVRCSPVRAEVGDTLRVDVLIEPFRDKRQIKSIALPVSGAWAGRKLRVLAGSTEEFMQYDQDRAADKFVPHSLRQMLDLIETVPDDGALSVRVYSEEAGVLLQGVELPALPPSLAAASLTGSSKGGIQQISGSLLLERRFETPWVLSGGEQVEVEVAR